jgi:hypothetical protein
MTRNRTLLGLSALAPLALSATLASAPTGAAAAGARGEASLRSAAAAFAELERKDVAKLSAALDALLADPALVEPFRARDRERLLATARPILSRLRAELNVTHWYFLDPAPDRTCFLRVHAPLLHGDVVKRETFSRAIATGQIGQGTELGQTAFAVRVVKPVRVGGEIVGYMELAEEIDHHLERMKERTGDDFALLVDKQRVDRAELARVRNDDRWDERPDVVLVNSTMWDESSVKLGVPLAKLPSDGVVIGEWKDGPRAYVGGAFPLRDASDRVFGALFVRHAVGAR